MKVVEEAKEEVGIDISFLGVADANAFVRNGFWQEKPVLTWLPKDCRGPNLLAFSVP